MEDSIKIEPVSCRLKGVSPNEFRTGALSELKTEVLGELELLDTRAAPAPLYGASIRDVRPRPGYQEEHLFPDPKNLYLIYFTMNDSKPSATLLYKQNIDKLEDAEQELFKDAKGGQKYKVGKNFRNIVWKEPTYVSFVLDEDQYDFYWETTRGHDAIAFKPNKEREISGILYKFLYDENWSFFNGRVENFQLTAADPVRKILRFTNYFKLNEAGDDLIDKFKTYCMDFVLWVPFDGGDREIHTIDPDTQNQGPDGP